MRFPAVGASCEIGMEQTDAVGAAGRAALKGGD
jgi:hypothetical protein